MTNVRSAGRVRASAAGLLYRLGNGLLSAGGVLRWPGARPAAAQRVCVFRIGNVGDVTCALPALRAVRRAYPGARLTLLTSPGKRGALGAPQLLEGADWIDEILVYHSDEIATPRQRLDLLRKLRARRFDVWIDLTPNLAGPLRVFRDFAFACMVSPRWARGWQIHTIRLWRQEQSVHLTFPNEVERLLDIVAAAGFELPALSYGLPLSDGSRAKIAGLVERLASGGRRIAALAPGAKRSTNEWPEERFAEVGRRLAAEGFAVALVGGAADTARCGRLAEMVGPAAANLAGLLSLQESCELLRRSDLLVCVDSGVQHLAAAVGTRCVSLFSFWQFIGKWRPHGRQHVVLQKWVPCHTCLLDECPHSNRCMTEITVPDVLAAIAGGASR